MNKIVAYIGVVLLTCIVCICLPFITLYYIINPKNKENTYETSDKNNNTGAVHWKKNLNFCWKDWIKIQKYIKN